jgi:hypothetical protein
MSEQHPASEWKGSTRGDAAWKEAKERVAARNDEVRKSGKREREEHERTREDARRAAELRRDAGMIKRGSR